jgi:nucleoside-diphosphate-sugar epimerase
VSAARDFAGASVLVTGGAGFVGSNLVRLLLADGAAQVRIVDNLLSAEGANVPDDERVEFTEGSIADDAVLATIGDDYDYVFHLSTYHGNQSSIHDPIADHEHNQLTTLKLLERVKSFRRLSKLVYAGAGCAVAEKTYDDAHATTEDAPISLKMDSPYSISKIVGEFYSVYYHGCHAVPTVRARFQNVYGPGEILGAGRWRGTPATVWRNVTPTFVYKALKGESLPLEAEGAASRDFVFVEDICRGLMACALRGTPGDVYNIASGIETTIAELAALINELTGNAAPVTVLPRRDWDNSGKRFGSTEKARRELGFAARVGLRDGLRRTVEWTRANLGLIESCMHKHDAFMRAYHKSSAAAAAVPAGAVG